MVVVVVVEEGAVVAVLAWVPNCNWVWAAPRCTCCGLLLQLLLLLSGVLAPVGGARRHCGDAVGR